MINIDALLHNADWPKAMRLRHLGGPGSGNFAHAGRPGLVGGSKTDGSGGFGEGTSVGDVTIVKKAKAPAATKEQVETAVKMKAEGHSYSSIEKMTGLNPKQAATIVHKHKKSQAAAVKVLAPAPEPKPSAAQTAYMMKKGYVLGADGATWVNAKNPAVTVSGELALKAYASDLGSKPSPKEQVIKMKFDGKSYAEIQAATGINPKHAATIVHQNKKATLATFPDGMVAKPDSEQAEAATMLENGYQWHEGAQVWKKGNSVVPTQFEKPSAVPGLPNATAKAILNTPGAVDYLDPTPLKDQIAKIAATQPADLAAKGYLWQEKTTGPAKGKYAFFKGGVQVSANAPKEDMAKVVSTINFGKGPDWVEPPAPGKVGGASGLIADKLQTGATLTQWPIDDSVVRHEGSKYPHVMDKQGIAWAGTLTADERAAVKSYTGSAYGGINKTLQSGKSSKTAELIDSALAKSPTPPPPELVWRRLSIGQPASVFNSLEAGDVIKLKGFQSTSISPTTWSGNLVMEIKPAAGAFVKTVSSHKGEQEYLLPHGMTYVVRGATTVSMGHGNNKQKVLQLQMLPPGAKS